MENIHSGHRDRLRSRFLKDGLESFEPHNQLELLLFYAVPQGDTNELAHRLLSRFQSISGVFDAPYEELVQVKGVGKVTAALIKLIPQLAASYLEDKGSHSALVLDSLEKLTDYLRPKFLAKDEECIYLLCFDNTMKLLDCSLISRGSLNSVEVSSRKVYESVVRHRATCVVLAHNHPVGFALPSRSDLDTTITLYQTLKHLNVDLVDHIIYGKEEFTSMRESGVFSNL